MKAFDLAERFQTPVFVMTDLDLGMNTWMSDEFPYPETPLDRGKRLDAATLQKLGDWGRYLDVDGDGIAVAHRARATACPSTSTAARATTAGASTASGRTTTRTTWTGWRASSRRRGSGCPAEVDRRAAGRGRRHRRLRHEPLGVARRPATS